MHRLLTMKAGIKRSLTFVILGSLASQGGASVDTEISPTVGALHAIKISSDDGVSDIKPMKFSIKEGATKDEAAEIKKKLEAAGAKVEIK